MTRVRNMLLLILWGVVAILVGVGMVLLSPFALVFGNPANKATPTGNASSKLPHKGPSGRNGNG